MKALIIYDSHAGNTQKVAEAIASGIEGCNAGLKDVHDVTLDDLKDVRLLIVGSGTHGIKPTLAITKFIESIPANALDGVNITAFDTRIEKENIKKLIFRLISDDSNFAARPIAEKLRKKGGTLVLLPEPFILEGENGPLKQGELERAKLWGRLACHA
jgi:flavodoxin